MKYLISIYLHSPGMSPLAMAEWIEIAKVNPEYKFHESPLAMAEWIEMVIPEILILMIMSPLAMAEWIEMSMPEPLGTPSPVSASDGGVD